MAYGIKAFDIRSRGRIEQVSISNPDTLDLTAYTVGDDKEVFIAIINKEHGTDARSADVNILVGADFLGAEVMYLTAPDNYRFATEGIALGGETINNDGIWKAKWNRLAFGDHEAHTVSVPPTSAAIVRIK